MDNLLIYFKKACSMPPQILFEKVVKKLNQYFSKNVQRFWDNHKGTYLNITQFTKPLNLRFNCQRIPIYPNSYIQILSCLSNNHLEHRFDLLGSGIIKVERGMSCNGFGGFLYHSDLSPNPNNDFINNPNYAESKRIRSLIQDDYCPIDWHIDFKSGYRWNPCNWYKDVIYGHLPGVDVKVPWELGRLQHLPQLAMAYGAAKNGCAGFKNPSVYIFEFRNQVLDFISGNPPRFGVNWSCTMDVAIRVANLLIAYDLFKASNAKFDPEFEVIFNRSIYEHGLHISSNLEWSSELRGNHYLADIVGLLFCSIYLPSNQLTNTWFAFSIQELIDEVKLQFNEDGSNFEASTAYHKLSAEMVIFATALVLGLDSAEFNKRSRYDCSLWKFQPPLRSGSIELQQFFNYQNNEQFRLSPFPNWYFGRLKLMANFSIDITKSNGNIVQIGDNDSGRFLKLGVSCNIISADEALYKYSNINYLNLSGENPVYIDENHLDHRPLVACINGLFKRRKFQHFSNGFEFLSEFVSILAKLNDNYSIVTSNSNMNHSTRDFINLNDFEKYVSEVSYDSKVHKFRFDGPSLIEQINITSYPNFGLYIIKSKNIFVSMRAGTVGQNGFGGHAHNDQLAVEIQVYGTDFISDPGTYVYTPLKDCRNNYRSIHAHFAPSLDGLEPCSLEDGLFRLSDKAIGKCIFIGDNEIICKASQNNIKIFRHLIIERNSIKVIDYYPRAHSISIANRPVAYSPGYGQLHY